MQQGKEASVTLSGTSPLAVIPLLYNGSARIGLFVLDGETPSLHVRPLNSEVHSTSALLPRLHRLLLGSLEIALKCTRPRQRFCCISNMLGEILCQRDEVVKEEYDKFLKKPHLYRRHNAIEFGSESLLRF